MSEKPFIRVRVTDGKPRDWRKLKPILGTYVHFQDEGKAIQFRLTTATVRQLDELRPKLGPVGLEEIPGESIVPSPMEAPALQQTSQSIAMRKSPHEQSTIAYRLMHQSNPLWIDFPRYWMAFNALYNYVHQDGDTEKSAISEVLNRYMSNKDAASCLAKHSYEIRGLIELPPGDDRLEPDDPRYREKTIRLVAEMEQAREPIHKLISIMLIVYQVRCNLLHGSKDDRVMRDQELVAVCTPILQTVVSALIDIMDQYK